MLLSDRVEALTGPDREVDELISAAIQGAVREVQSDGRVAFHSADGARWVSIAVGNYTASLDAAWTLKPESCLVSVQNRRPYEYVWFGLRYHERHETYTGKNMIPALALTAAALRSRGL
jgi:hypothetical protein